ncbi:hypothetical protein D6D02_03459 [Aureobasidium pullulans]|nr:hypothetical protein D6D02_03459 [Aureobasidium pullulans]
MATDYFRQFLSFSYSSTGEVHPTESLSSSIALLADDPGEWIRTCRLLETLSAQLSSYAETEDQIIDLTLELEFYDVEMDLLLRRVARSSSSIVNVYEKLRDRKWYNSLPPITKFTTNEEHTRQIVNKHIEFLDALSQTHNLLESTAKNIDTIDHRLNRAKARIFNQLQKVLLTSSTRTRLNGAIIEEFREVVGVADHTRRDRDALRVAAEEELDGKTVNPESRRVQ